MDYKTRKMMWIQKVLHMKDDVEIIEQCVSQNMNHEIYKIRDRNTYRLTDRDWKTERGETQNHIVR